MISDKKMLMKNILIAILTFVALNISAQDNQQMKIVMQLTSADTLVHKGLMKQLNNITSVEPDVKIQVICHGPGMDLLLKEKSVVQQQISALHQKGIEFKACEFTLKEKQIDKSQLIQEVGFVEAGIVAIVRKQMEGWYYIKSGF
jgi:uncharacterized protein